MGWRLKILIILATWGAALALNLWATLGRHYLLALPIGFLSCPAPFSVSLRLATGKWPDWRAVWRLFTGKDKL